MAAFAGKLAQEVSVVDDVAALLATGPNLVVECAGHGAVRAAGAKVLRGGCDLLVVSTGALSDDALHAELLKAAEAGDARLLFPAGAVGAIDLLGAAKLSGLIEVAYSSRKPPHAWLKTPAEKAVDLNSLREETVFYEGNAREAARDYPQNANVAATVALAGAGFDKTRVRLIADPAVTTNTHEIAVRSQCVNFSIRIEGRPSPANPKTSLSAAYSLAREVLNSFRREVI
jgi:aspartate dehydrogenase